MNRHTKLGEVTLPGTASAICRHAWNPRHVDDTVAHPSPSAVVEMGRGSGRGGDSPAPLVFGFCIFSWFICSIFMLAFSFDTLQPNVMALLYNENTCFLDSSKLYNQERGDSGRYFTGLGQSFVEFPRMLKSVKFNSEEDAHGSTVTARTFNGTAVALDLAFQYELERTPAAVSTLYATFGDDFERFFVKYARQVVRDVVSDHIVMDLWEKRREMGEAMRDALDVALRAKHARVMGLQILSLTIPQDIQNAIEATSTAFQKIGEARFEKQATTVKALTKRLVAEKTSEVTVLQAESSSQALLEDVRAKAAALNVTIQSESDVLSLVKNTFSFTNEQLLRYVWLGAIAENNAQKVTIAVNQPGSTKAA